MLILLITSTPRIHFFFSFSQGYFFEGQVGTETWAERDQKLGQGQVGSHFPDVPWGGFRLPHS